MSINNKKDINNKSYLRVTVFALAFLIVLALICFYIWKRNESNVVSEELTDIMEIQEADQEKMKQELYSISENLNRMDESIVNNHGMLGEITGYNTELSEKIETLETSLTSVEKNLRECLNKNENISEEIRVNVADIIEKLTTVHEDISDTKETILSLLAELNSAEGSRQEEIEGEFIKVKEELEENKEILKSSYDSLNAAIELLQMQDKKEYEQLLAVMQETEEKMDSLTELISENNKILQFQIEKNVELLSGRMDSLHNKISDTQLEIASLLSVMEEADQDRQEEIRAEFADINEDIAQINADFLNTMEEVKALILQLEQTESENHAQLLDVLANMETDMENDSSQNLSQILNTMDALEKNYLSTVALFQEEMSQNFQDMNTSLDSRISNLQETVDNQYSSLTTIVNTGDDGLRSYLDEGFGRLNERLESVFRYVSDGKKLLASALLTKGVSCREDATFSEIYQSILAIPQEVVIGVQEIPGIVSYEYHYHIDGEGNQIHAEKVNASGGCFTAPAYHVHEGSSVSGDGCYTQPVYRYHAHSDSCYTYGIVHSCYVIHTDSHGTDDIGRNWYTWTYSCGATVSGTSGDGYHGHTTYGNVLTCGKSTSTVAGIAYYTPGCGKTTNTIEGYAPACGFCDGQIIGAHIVYDNSAITAFQWEETVTDTEGLQQEEASVEEMSIGMYESEENKTEGESDSETLTEADEVAGTSESEEEQQSTEECLEEEGSVSEEGVRREVTEENNMMQEGQAE